MSWFCYSSSSSSSTFPLPQQVAHSTSLKRENFRQMTGVSCSLCKDKKRRHYLTLHFADAQNHENVGREERKKIGTRMGLGRAGLNTIEGEERAAFLDAQKDIGSLIDFLEGRSSDLTFSSTAASSIAVVAGYEVAALLPEKLTAVRESGVAVHEVDMAMEPVVGPGQPGDLVSITKLVEALVLTQEKADAPAGKAKQQGKSKGSEKKKGKGNARGTDCITADNVPKAVEEILACIAAALEGEVAEGASARVCNLKLQRDMTDIVMGVKNAAFARGHKSALST